MPHYCMHAVGTLPNTLLIGNKSEQVKEDSKVRPQAKDLKDGEAGVSVAIFARQNLLHPCMYIDICM